MTKLSTSNVLRRAASPHEFRWNKRQRDPDLFCGWTTAGRVYEARFFDLTPWTTVAWIDREGDHYIAHLHNQRLPEKRKTLRAMQRVVEQAVVQRISK